MKFYESILPFVLPLLADKADESATTGVAEDAKRLGYTILVALGSEGVEKLSKAQSGIPLEAFKAIHAEAVQEFEEAGIGDVPAKLDGFVTFA